MALETSRNQEAMMLARRSAGLAANNAEASLQRALDEPRRLPAVQISASMTVTAVARQLTEIAAAMEHLSPQEFSWPNAAERNALRSQLDALATAIAERRAPLTAPPLELEGEPGDIIATELQKVAYQLALLQEAARILAVG
ncbi:MAG: hypothetical protein JSR80_07240 [Verrucomicrobia bacterium]|nr:hypothetical protein [Verrucomicrobiota bacterium]